MANSPREDPEVFVIRIWTEKSPEAGGLQRGYVEHLATGQRRYFSDLADALEFVGALGERLAPELRAASDEHPTAASRADELSL